MIQRKQTLFLIISIIFSIVCLCLPVGYFRSGTGMTEQALYNLWLKAADGSCTFSTSILFALLIITCTISIATIFMYHNRKKQIRMCFLNIVILIAWYAAYFTIGFITGNGDNTEFRISVTAAFPAISLILNVMARKAVIADEELIKSADRIR